MSVPPPTSNRRPRWPLVAMAVVLVVAVVLGVLLLVGQQLGDDPAETSSTPAAGASESAAPPPPPPTPTREATRQAPPTPTATTSAAPPTEDDSGRPEANFEGTGMQETRLYNVMWENGSQACSPLPGGLPEPPLPDDELAGHLDEIVDCLMEVHQPALAAEDITLGEPKIVTYGQSQSTPCGTLTDQNPAYYCSGDQTIYVRLAADEDPDGFARSSMGYWILISHEFGHHLQTAAGIFDDYARALEGANADQELELSRRLELQANCFSGVFLGAARENLTYDDNYNATRNFYRFNSDDQSGVRSHGTGANAVAWFETGYDQQWNAFARCNTWAAPDDRVA